MRICLIDFVPNRHLTDHDIDVRTTVDQWFTCVFTAYLPVSAIERYQIKLVFALMFCFILYQCFALPEYSTDLSLVHLTF